MRRIGGIAQEHKLKVKEKFSPVSPYCGLDASSLKLTGTGRWPLESFLDDVLWLQFVEPAWT